MNLNALETFMKNTHILGGSLVHRLVNARKGKRNLLQMQMTLMHTQKRFETLVTVLMQLWVVFGPFWGGGAGGGGGGAKIIFLEI